MSNFIQIPSDITTKLTKRSKYKTAYLYMYIRNQINKDRDTINAKEKTKLKYGEALNLDEKTIYTYIKDLNDVGLISGIGKDWGIDHRYNVYHFPEINGDNFIVLPSLIDDTNLTIEEKGVMLFIKANCYNGANHFHFKSMAEITNDAFPLYLNGKPENYIYHLIYNYCLYKGVVPPIKEERALFYLKTKYSDGYTRLKEDLLCKCKNLPKEISLNYFCMALLNMMPEKRSNLDLEFIM